MRNSNFVTKQQSTLNLKMKKKLRVKILKYSFTFLGIDLICISMIRHLQLKTECDERIIKFVILIMKLEGKEKLKKSLVVISRVCW